MKDEQWRRVQDLFEEASQLPHGEREGFLERCIGSDFETLQEVRQLLEASPPANFLEPPSGSDLPASRFFGGDLEGSTLGDFQLLEQIGRGGSGVVYLARQRGLDRRVAVKLLPLSKSSDKTTMERFRREARAASRLDHPSINPVFGFGESEGVVWFGMSYVEGHDFAEELRRQSSRRSRTADEPPILPPFDTPEYAVAVIERVAELAEGVQYAHDHGIIHRDVKPQNILVRRDGRLILVDFGLAKNEDAATLTSADKIAGTLPYMSPEQANTVRARVDHRTDVYSLSVVLYEALTLQRPFRGSTAAETLTKIGSGTYVGLRKLNRKIPRDLALVCEKGMARRPEDRYPTAAALSADLRRFLRHEAVTANAPSAWMLFLRWAQKRRVAVSAGVALVVGLVAAAVFADVRQERARIEDWRQRLTLALEEDDWGAAYPTVLQARRAVEEMEEEEVSFDELGRTVIEFETRRLEDHRVRSAGVADLLAAAENSMSRDEKESHLVEAVQLAGKAAVLHHEDGWLNRMAGIEAVFPRVSLDVAAPTDATVTVVASRINPVRGEIGPRERLGTTPVVDRPIKPGDYRFTFESDDGLVAEIERDGLSLGDVVSARVEPRPRAALPGMIRIHGGDFRLQVPRPLGCLHAVDSVLIEDFYLDEAEVSNQEYLEFLAATGRRAPSIWREAGYDGVDWRSLPVEEVGDVWLDLPVSGMSWEDARAYAEWAGKRLPTHLELEWALRGPQLLSTPWGDSSDRGGLRANLEGPGRSGVRSWREAYREAVQSLVPVRVEDYRHPPSQVFHAYGNVQEWTSSRVVEWAKGKAVVHDLGRYKMGGDWSAATDGQTLADHATANIGDAHASPRVGFRCARTAFD